MNQLHTSKFSITSIVLLLLQIRITLETCPQSAPCSCSVQGNINKSYVLEVHCDKTQYTSLPDLLPLAAAPLFKLNLRQNKIKDLPADGFIGLKFRTLDREVIPVLDVSSNPIITISEFAFRGIKADAVDLDLSNCSLEVIPHEALNK
mgnify:CR=1 FL=1